MLNFKFRPRKLNRNRKYRRTPKMSNKIKQKNGKNATRQLNTENKLFM